MLGLADQVIGNADGIGRVISHNGDFGGPCFGIYAHDAAAKALGGGDVDVAGSGDHVHGFELVGVVTVGQQRHGLRTAHGPHLLHSQQLAGRQDGGVRPTAELGLRRRCHHQRGHTRFLRGHHVHDHTGWVYGVAARHVQAHAFHRDKLLRHRPAGREFHRVACGFLRGMHGTHTGDGFPQRLGDLGVQFARGVFDDVSGHAYRRRLYPIKLLPVLQRCLRAAPPHLPHQRLHHGKHRINVRAAARQGSP